jgi:hypothetical protein
MDKCPYCNSTQIDTLVRERDEAIREGQIALGMLTGTLGGEWCLDAVKEAERQRDEARRSLESVLFWIKSGHFDSPPIPAVVEMMKAREIAMAAIRAISTGEG